MSFPQSAVSSSDGAKILGRRIAGIALVAFAVELASVTARNADLLSGLAKGRDLLAGKGWPSTGWPFDLLAFALHSVGDGTALLAAKCLAVAVVAVLLFRECGHRGGWAIPSLASGCAILAMNHRLPLHPSVASIVFLILALRLTARRTDTPNSHWPGWRLVALFAIWANVHDWWIFGFAVVMLDWIGQRFDREGRARATFGPIGLLVLFCACLLSPVPFEGLKVPAVLQRPGHGGDSGLESFVQGIHSPFSESYRTFFIETPAALAYYAILALGTVSFAMNRSGWRLSRFLPFAAAAGLSAVEARTIPLFAIVAAPVLSRNFGERFAREPDVPSRSRRYGAFLAPTVAVAFLVAGWPGWLQSTPYEPRRWAFEPPADLAAGANACRSFGASRRADSRTLHLTRDSLAAFAWYCPDDAGTVSDRAIEALLRPVEELDAAERELAELRIDRIVVRGGDPLGDLHLARLLADAGRWPLAGVDGGIAIFVRRSELPPGIGPVDLDRIAYRPTDGERAPVAQPTVESGGSWWWTFQPAGPGRAAGRDEARLHLKIVESLGSVAPFQHILAWETVQVAGLVGALNSAAGTIPVGAALRWNLYQPALPDADPFAKAGPPPLSRTVFALQQRFALDRGQASPGRVYSAIRAARRATAETPADAAAHYALGKAYLALPQQTTEQRWGSRLPQLARLRNVQASAALNRAVALNPALAEAHLELGFLYQGAGCFDLALNHLKDWQQLETIRLRAGGDRARLDRLEPVVERIEKEVAKQRAEFEKETSRISVGDRAVNAVRRGLGGAARDLLLKSDVAAFGKTGTDIEIDFLLRTGRPQDVLDWLTPEVQGTVGPFPFHWSRAQALAALGHYSASREELAATLVADGRVPTPASVRNRIGDLVGRAVLDEGPNRHQLPQVVLHEMRHSDFVSHMLELEATLARECDAAILIGLLAMESGHVDVARDRFQSALALAPRRGGVGQLNAPSLEVAREALDLLDRFRKE